MRNEIIAIINTGGLARATKLEWDPKDHLLIVGNPRSRQTPVNFLTRDQHGYEADPRQDRLSELDRPRATRVGSLLRNDSTSRSTGVTSEVDVIDPTKVAGKCAVTTGTNCGVISQVLFHPVPASRGMALLP